MIRPYLELARLSNLPTVWSNVLVGLYAGFTAMLVDRGQAHFQATSGSSAQATWNGWSLLGSILDQAFMVLVAVSCFYIAGMVLNDLLDLRIDEQERPARPLPSGRVSPIIAGGLVVVLFLLGLLGLAVYAQPGVLLWGVLLVAAIVLYDAIHQRTAGAVIFMGAARALVYLTAAAIFPVANDVIWWRFVGPFALILFVYIVLISVIARLETADNLGLVRWLAPFMAVLVLAGSVIARPNGRRWIWVVIAAAFVIFWLARAAQHALAQPPRTGQAVTMWLSGICLMDAFFLALLGFPTPAFIAGCCWLLTVLAHRRIPGT